MRRVFVSDVHLAPDAPGRTRRFLDWLETEGPRADEFYVLGDLFDSWVGRKHLQVADHREAIDALSRLAAERRVIFVAGNRDFYLRGFPEATGVEVAEGKTWHWLETEHERVWLCHGDYLQDRPGFGGWLQELFRRSWFEALYTALPACAARAGARFYRWVSGEKPSPPPVEGWTDLALAPERVADRFRRGADTLVCGHVHVAGIWHPVVDGTEKRLVTLGDWADGVSYAVETGGQWTLETE